MRKYITSKTTTNVFYSGIAMWVMGLIVGGLFQLPYVQHRYRMVTPLLYAGGLILLLALCNLASGRAWRWHHRVASRNYDARTYWAIVGTMIIIGATLLCIGLINWFRLP